MNWGRDLFTLIWIFQELLLTSAFPVKTVRSSVEESEKTMSEVIFPRIYPLFVKDGSSGTKEFVLIIKTFGNVHYLHLQRVEEDPLLKFSPSNVSSHNSNESCHHYTGKSLTQDNSVAAVYLCGTLPQVSGIILKESRIFIVRPLDLSESNWNMIDGLSEQPDDAISHLIYSPSNQYKSFCGTDTRQYSDERERIAVIHKRRMRRADDKGRKVIETAVYVDYALYKKLSVSSQSEHNDTMTHIRNTVLAIVNEVQLIYNYNSLSTKFKIVVVKLEVLSENKEAPDPANGDIDQYLDNFCAWQSLQNPPASSKGHWDHALMLTGLNLYKTTISGIRNEKVLGLAWVNGMCRPQHSCTLNEGTSFEAAFVIAHEMGHSLGMLHDGRGNDCDPNIFLMSEKTGPGKITWSDCSNEYLYKFFEKGYGACLEDDNSPPDDILDHEGELPGNRFSLADQCKMSLGENFKPHIVPKQPFDNVCRELWCVSGLWASVAHPALEGSGCGNGKYCHQGRCKGGESNIRLPSPEKAITVDVKGTVADFLDRLKYAFKILAV